MHTLQKSRVLGTAYNSRFCPGLLLCGSAARTAAAYFEASGAGSFVYMGRKGSPKKGGGGLPGTKHGASGSTAEAGHSRGKGCPAMGGSALPEKFSHLPTLLSGPSHIAISPSAGLIYIYLDCMLCTSCCNALHVVVRPATNPNHGDPCPANRPCLTDVSLGLVPS